MNKKVILYIIAVILVICAGILIVKNTNKPENVVETSKNYNNVKNENKISNEVNNSEKKGENKTEEKVNNIETQEKNEEVIENVNKENINEEDNKEKAIKIAKKDWGTDETVYFEFDQIDSKGNYIIAVRQKSSTKAVFWYTVDIENEKIID